MINEAVPMDDELGTEQETQQDAFSIDVEPLFGPMDKAATQKKVVGP
jgi:hypothetical protein